MGKSCEVNRTRPGFKLANEQRLTLNAAGWGELVTDTTTDTCHQQPKVMGRCDIGNAVRRWIQHEVAAIESHLLRTFCRVSVGSTESHPHLAGGLNAHSLVFQSYENQPFIVSPASTAARWGSSLRHRSVIQGVDVFVCLFVSIFQWIKPLSQWMTQLPLAREDVLFNCQLCRPLWPNYTPLMVYWIDTSIFNPVILFVFKLVCEYLRPLHDQCEQVGLSSGAFLEISIVGLEKMFRLSYLYHS